MITEENYTIKGYHKKKTYDAKGDLIVLEFYGSYDGITYSDLKIKETNVFTRDLTTGLVTKRIKTIEFYKGGIIIVDTKVTEKFYTASEGYDANKTSRGILINNASMYLLSQVGLADGKLFLDLVVTQVAGYIDGSTQPLLDAVSTSGETYMTPTIKGTLDVILNIVY